MLSEQSASHEYSVYSDEDNGHDIYEQPEDSALYADGHDASDDERIDVKPVFETIQLDQDDISAFAALSFSRVGEPDPLENIGSSYTSNETHANRDSPEDVSEQTGALQSSGISTTETGPNPENQVRANATIDSNSIEPNATVAKITYKYDVDVEYSYNSVADFAPIQLDDGYLIKPHDILSDNRPFKPNVSLLYIENYCRVFKIIIVFSKLIKGGW